MIQSRRIVRPIVDERYLFPGRVIRQKPFFGEIQTPSGGLVVCHSVKLSPLVLHSVSSHPTIESHTFTSPNAKVVVEIGKW